VASTSRERGSRHALALLGLSGWWTKEMRMDISRTPHQAYAEVVLQMFQPFCPIFVLILTLHSAVCSYDMNCDDVYRGCGTATCRSIKVMLGTIPKISATARKW
jgi:hypothetical protein